MPCCVVLLCCVAVLNRQSVGVLSARDESYSLFHSVGKVLFSKSDADADLIIERCAADVSTLLAFVHSNYTTHMAQDSDLERTADVAHAFALADDIAQAQHSAAMGDVSEPTAH